MSNDKQIRSSFYTMRRSIACGGVGNDCHRIIESNITAPARNDSTAEAALTDFLEFGYFLSSWPSVGDVMDTEGEILCYRYDVSTVAVIHQKWL